jgi:hypothetical protein
MYQPRIEDDHIRALYQWAKRLEMPMTRLVNALLAHALARLEEGAETIQEPAGRAYRPRSTRGKSKSRARDR